MENSSAAVSMEMGKAKFMSEHLKATPAGGDVHLEAKGEASSLESVMAEINKLDAECQFERALLLMEIHPLFVDIQIRKTKLLVKTEQDAAAQEIFSDLLSHDDSNVQALLAFGFFLASKDEMKKAKQYFRKALNLSAEGDPNWKRAQRGLILTSRAWDKGHCRYWILKRKAQCFSSTSKKRSFFFQGKAAHRRGWHAQAKACFEMSMQSGGYKDDCLRWAFCCVALGDFEEALKFFRKRPDTYDRVLQLIEELQKVNDGQCPYKILHLRVGSKLRDVRYAYDRRMKDVESPEELQRLRKGFLLLADYETKMEYDSTHLEVDSYLPK
ncbi:uncharacterized protein [Palaemon carinicauda]|uniref:uncharacterized protein n=1 Tax=Palaemon carinicauda TaxID=392227 RepID=UPI0035B69EAC